VAVGKGDGVDGVNHGLPLPTTILCQLPGSRQSQAVGKSCFADCRKFQLAKGPLCRVSRKKQLAKKIAVGKEPVSCSDGIPLFIIGMADWLKEQRLQQLHQRKDEDDEHEGFAMHYEEQVPRLPAWLEQAMSSAFNNDVPNDDMRLLLFYMSMFPYGYKFEKDR
jgi:hypothetical protein